MPQLAFAPLRGRLAAVLAVLAVFGLAPSGAAAQAPQQLVPPPVDAAGRAAIVEDLVRALDEVYVFPDVAKKMGEHVRGQLRSGAYDSLGDLDSFTQRLTADFQSVSKDLHLRVERSLEEPGPMAGAEPTPQQRRERFAAQLRRDNGCFRKVEVLAGNVGYVKLDCFAAAQLAGDTAVAAMAFLRGADALIFDLRDNGGGAPSMIQLLTSYLVGDEPEHLNSFYVRRGDRTEQFWTQAWIPGERRPEVPAFVLTSGRTFSAAEEFTYNLKSMGRATIVGETTGGGAHPVDQHRVAGYPVVMSLPFGRAVNPITGTNWEGTGVEPDVKVPAAEALAAAHVRALDAVAERATDPEAKARAEFARDAIEGRRAPVALGESEMAAYAGTYGPRVITLADGALWYQRGRGARHRLLPLGSDRFLVGELTDFRIRFERDASGRVVRLVGQYENGREEPNARSGE